MRILIRLSQAESANLLSGVVKDSQSKILDKEKLKIEPGGGESGENIQATSRDEGKLSKREMLKD